MPELLEGEDPSDFEGAPPADRSREARAHRRAWTSWLEAQCLAWWDAAMRMPSADGPNRRRIRGEEKEEWGALMATAQVDRLQAWRQMVARGEGVLVQVVGGGLVGMPAGVDPAGDEVAQEGAALPVGMAEGMATGPTAGYSDDEDAALGVGGEEAQAATQVPAGQPGVAGAAPGGA